jgi:hypothetical protein
MPFKHTENQIHAGDVDITPPGEPRGGGDGEPKLTIEIQNRRPIELLDLTESFLSLGDEYKRFVAANPDMVGAQNVRLYIKEIRAGSVVADLVALVGVGVPVALPYIENANNILDFAKYLKGAYGYFSGKEEEKPQLHPTEYTNLSKIIEPVAKDNGSQINITATDGGTVNITFNLNSTEANAAQNNLRREIEQFREPETKVHNQVLLYWYRASRDTDKQVGDRAIIESISPNPVKTVFDEDKTKAEMILSDPNPFLSAYIVDVFVDTIRGKPALYKIIRLHDRIEKPE